MATQSMGRPNGAEYIQSRVVTQPKPVAAHILRHAAGYMRDEPSQE